MRSSLEMLKNAGIKVWMLTGDKQETAICIAKSSGLFAKTENIHTFGSVLNRMEAHSELMALQRYDRIRDSKRNDGSNMSFSGAAMSHLS